MRLVKGLPPKDFASTHVRVSSGLFASSLEAAGVPLVRYVDDYPALPWAPRWAARFAAEWVALENGTPNVLSEAMLQRVVSWVLRSGEVDLADAALSVYRLTGDLDEVKKMLQERKDLA